MLNPKTSEGLVLFVDVAGSTQLYEDLGDIAAYTKISTCLALLGDIVGRYGGIVVKHIGDEVLCFFGDVVAGIRAAIVAQIEMHTSSEKSGLPVRIGCHYGAVLIRNGDLFGDTVNIAAHLASLAKASQVLTSELTLKRYETKRKTHVVSYQIHGFLNFDQALETRFFCRLHPKGKQFQVDAYTIQWEMFMDDMIADWTYVKRIPGMAVMQGLFMLEGIGGVFTLNQSRITVGRTQGADILVNDRNVSRQHGIFEMISGQVRYTDQSSNGTYLETKAGDCQFIHRASVLVTSEGRLSFGIAFNELESHSIALFKFWFDSQSQVTKKSIQS